jgi:hypothetical protein
MKSAINGGIVALVGLILIVAAQNSPLGWLVTSSRA